MAESNIKNEKIQEIHDKCKIMFNFITGTPCGGKTTVSRALVEKYGFELFDVDERFDEQKKCRTHYFSLR